jgi:hypothetical protein
VHLTQVCGHAQTPIHTHQIPSSNRFKLHHLRKSPEKTRTIEAIFNSS